MDSKSKIYYFNFNRDAIQSIAISGDNKDKYKAIQTLIFKNIYFVGNQPKTIERILRQKGKNIYALYFHSERIGRYTSGECETANKIFSDTEEFKGHILTGNYVLTCMNEDEEFKDVDLTIKELKHLFQRTQDEDDI